MAHTTTTRPCPYCGQRQKTYVRRGERCRRIVYHDIQPGRPCPSSGQIVGSVHGGGR